MENADFTAICEHKGASSANYSKFPYILNISLVAVKYFFILCGHFRINSSSRKNPCQKRTAVNSVAQDTHEDKRMKSITKLTARAQLRKTTPDMHTTPSRTGQPLLLSLFLIMLITACDEPSKSAEEKIENHDTDYAGAVHMESRTIGAWATGYTEYTPGTNCDTKWQTPAKALGAAEGTSYDIVCLGEGGSITLTFDEAIADGDGADFAVFENSFSKNFLELAFIGVSNDGENFYTFPTLAETAEPVGEYGTVVFSSVYDEEIDYTGFAGVHPQGYGTLFDIADIAELTGKPITHIRITDIIGDGSTMDSGGNVIYDPYPQKESAGFDLDAVGVIRN